MLGLHNGKCYRDYCTLVRFGGCSVIHGYGSVEISIILKPNIENESQPEIIYP